MWTPTCRTYAIVIGGPDTNALTAEILERCDPSVRQEFDWLMKRDGHVRFFIPAEVPVEKAWVPNADLRDARALPVLIIAGERPEDTAQWVRDAAFVFRRRHFSARCHCGSCRDGHCSTTTPSG